MEVVFGVLREAKLYATRLKCQFLRRRLEYLAVNGHQRMIKCAIPSKIPAIIDLRPPTCKREVRSFLALTSYYK